MGTLDPQPKLHVETLIDLPLARESSSNGLCVGKKKGTGSATVSMGWG